MTKAEKTTLIENLTADFKASNAIAVCDYKGLTVKQLESLRANAREQNVKVQVIKNTLALIALSTLASNSRFRRAIAFSFPLGASKSDSVKPYCVSSSFILSLACSYSPNASSLLDGIL